MKLGKLCGPFCSLSTWNTYHLKPARGMNCGQNPCKVFVRKRNNEQNNIHVDNKAYEKTSHKIDEVFPNISKQAKRISENNRNCERMPEELETLRN